MDNNSIQVYPNPATDHFYIKGAQAGVARIWNLQGKEVMYVRFQKEAINLTPLKQGYYIIQIESQDGDRMMSKFQKL